MLFCMTTSWTQIQLLDDEFNDSETLQNWNNINIAEGWNISQLETYNIDDSTEGQFFIKPITESWFGEYRGAYLFKFVQGDFILTTEIKVTARDGVSLPSSSFSLAGIMVRTPLHYPNQDPAIDWQPGQQNYIFMSIGQATGPGFDFEIKNTCNSNSCLDIVPINFNTAKIRMVRKGNEIVVLSQLPGGNWEVRNRYNRLGLQCGSQMNNCNAPFPDTLQIGLVAYTDWPKVSSYNPAFHNSNTLHPDSLGGSDPTPGVPFNPDIIGNFDFFRFDSLTIPSDLEMVDLADTSLVPDSVLLAHFGYSSASYCPSSFHIYDTISNKYLQIHAGQVLQAENRITNASNVTFSASNQITLLPGFEIDGSSTLTIHLAGCLAE